MQKFLLKDSKSVDCWPHFWDKMQKIWMTMTAQKFKIFSKRTVRGSALVTFSDTKQGFTVPRGMQGCTKNGLCNICKFLYVFIVFVFTTNSIVSTRHDFFYSIHFEKLSLRNRRLIKKTILFKEKLFLTTTIKKGNLGPAGTNLFQIADCVSVPTFCHFVDHLWILLENSSFKNLWRINCLSWNFVQCGRIHFTLTNRLWTI